LTLKEREKNYSEILSFSESTGIYAMF
jgi:hypothetical protein